jgi:hypothetical protein
MRMHRCIEEEWSRPWTEALGFHLRSVDFRRSKLDACEPSKFHVLRSSVLHRGEGSTEMTHMPLGLGLFGTGSMSQHIFLSSRSREAKFNHSVSAADRRH